MNRVAIGLLSTLVALAACQTTGVDRAESAANAMKAQYKALVDAPAKIEAVVTTLKGLAEPGADMKKQWEAFTGAVASVESHRSRIQGLRKEIDANQTAFMEEWQKRLDSITDEELRQRATERRDVVAKKFASLNADAEAGKAVFEPWMATVKSLKAYLENDLNPSGVASVTDKIKAVSEGAPEIESKIQKIVDELDAMAASIQAGKPPAPSAASTTSGG